MRRGTWFNTFAAEGGALDLRAQTRDATRFINDVLSGPKYLEPKEFKRVSEAFNCRPHAVHVNFRVEDERLSALISDMVRCYGVSLVRNRAVVLLDAVEFSLQSPLDQMAMLNSLAYSVNSAYGQLLLKDIRIDFARTTTGDGFYIWNRATTLEANAALYKLMMMILSDNAVAQRKARSAWVPKLRAAFHIGEHYEFRQVEGLNPTHFSYLVGQVTVDLSRMVDRALPGQILLGEFLTQVGGNASGCTNSCGTVEFVENPMQMDDRINCLTCIAWSLLRTHVRFLSAWQKTARNPVKPSFLCAPAHRAPWCEEDTNAGQNTCTARHPASGARRVRNSERGLRL